jgi:hypothetical protein
MSATRRAASETNILAMLDRQASAALPQRILRAAQALPAMFWYGTAGMLVCGLVATLAWLARDSGASAAVDTALAGSITPARARVAEAAGLRAADASASVTAYVPAYVPANVPAHVPAHAPADAPASVSAPLSDPAPRAGATVVNLAPAAPSAPAELAVQTTAVPAHPSPAPVAALPQQQSGRIAPRELQRDPQRLAAHAAAARSAALRAAAQGRPAPSGTVPAALAHASRTAAHSRRPAQPAKAPPAAVDTDVALISAIIQHAASRQETDEAACADKACGPRMPARP